MTMTKQTRSRLPFLYKLVREIIEALVIVWLVSIMNDKGMSTVRLLRAAVVIGVVTTLLDYYDADFQSKIKEGLTFSAGSNLIPS